MARATKEKNGGNMRLDKNKIIMLLFEIALIFLLFQENVFPSELTFISLLLTIVFGIFFLAKGGKLYLNPNSKVLGRSAYVCKNKECINKLIKKKILKNALKINDLTQIEQELLNIIIES